MGCDLLVPWDFQLDLGTRPPRNAKDSLWYKEEFQEKQLKLGKTPFMSASTWHFQFDESIFVG
jgi:hypothetical protein